MKTDEVAKTLTAEAFQKLPDEPGHYRLELVRGMVVRSPGPGITHGQVEANIILVLGEFVRRKRLGTVLGYACYVVERGPDTVRGPDVSFVRAGRFPGRRYPVGYAEGSPDLAIEILSPSNRPGEVRQRMEDLFRGGCREFWIVNPRRRTVTVHTPDGPEVVLGPDDELTSPLLPGFRCHVREFYRFD